MKIVVIDGQGGGIGKSLVAEIKKADICAEVIAVGTNAYAASAMQKAGADRTFTGEKAAADNAASADIITGPIGIAMAGSLKGEITAKIASAVSGAAAIRILVPLNKCGTIVVGVSDTTLTQNIKEVADRIKKLQIDK